MPGRKLSHDIVELSRFSLRAEPECLLGDPLGVMSAKTCKTTKPETFASNPYAYFMS